MEMPPPSPSVLSRRGAIVARLREACPGGVIDDPAETRAYECDALTAYACRPLCVVLPSSTAEVAACLRVCHEEGAPVVPRGAGTSLAGGALPTADSVVLGVARMTRVLEASREDRLIRVEVGRTNLSVTAAAEPLGMFYAPDPSSQLACTVAGNVGMNSGGAHCLKYGVTTNNLLGVTAVLADGTVVELGHGSGEALGLDLLAAVCGSEGQLCVVTEAALRLVPRPEGARPVLLAFGSAEAAGACVSAVIRAGLIPVAIEFMDRPCIEACEAFAKAGYPDCEALLIVEVEGPEAEIADQMGRIGAIARGFAPLEIREARGAEEAARIWLGRKSAFGAMGRIADYLCLDGTIPVSRLSETLAGIAALGDRWGLRVANVFHAGDGNMHPLILFDANSEDGLRRAEGLGADILRLCVAMGGCLTGEHGVGVEKRDLMGEQYRAEDLEAQMRVKDAFDPGWMLNPAKVFPLQASASRRAA